MKVERILKIYRSCYGNLYVSLVIRYNGNIEDYVMSMEIDDNAEIRIYNNLGNTKDCFIYKNKNNNHSDALVEYDAIENDANFNITYIDWGV